MKKMIIAVVAMGFCALAVRAETVAYSVPVLTVQSEGPRVVTGSGRLNTCPFSFVGTTNAAPVKVSVVEDMPSGAGKELRASLWLAVTTAALSLNRDLAGAQVTFETSGYVDGPSAGGMFCLAVMSAIEGRSFPTDFAMTGTIMADGTIGPVGGVAEKIRAAGKAGIKRICIPSFTRMDEEATDLLDLGKRLKIEMHPVATISEAYRILHRLPSEQIARLNPTDVCRLPSPIERILKDQYVEFVRASPHDGGSLNPTLAQSVEEFRAGLFGAAAMNQIEGLEQDSFLSGSDVPCFNTFPVLAHELPTNGTSSVGAHTKAKYVEALRDLHQDLACFEESLMSTVSREGQRPGEAQTNDWFDDYVESPGGAQFATLATLHLAKRSLWERACGDITSRIDSLEDWDRLEAQQLNDLRALLLDKLQLLSCMELYLEDKEIYARANALYCDLQGTIPYIRPNPNVHQVENIFYRTMRAMDAALIEGYGGEARSVAVLQYQSLLCSAETLHGRTTQETETLQAVFAEAHALSMACALFMGQATGSPVPGGGNLAFYSAVVSTARENALVNISNCQKAGIPCVMPVIDFQLAESNRDRSALDADAELMRLMVFAHYLQASLSAKALELCFRGRRPELNAKGYCSKSVTVEMRNPETLCQTVRYLGIDGKPVLREGASGYRVTTRISGRNPGTRSTCRLDLNGKEIIVK